MEDKQTPLRSIRRYCVDVCCAGSHKEVRICPVNDSEYSCPLHPYRMGHKPVFRPELSTLQAIKARCQDCSTGDRYSVKHCPYTTCPLFPYRLGHNPKRQEIGGSFDRSDEHKKTPIHDGENDETPLRVTV